MDTCEPTVSTWATLIVHDNTQILFDKVRAVEEMLRQTEEDADKEILEMKTSYEIELKREAESNVKIRLGGEIVKVMWQVDNSDIGRGELGILKKKHMVVHKDLEDQKSGIHSMQVGFEIFNIQIFNISNIQCRWVLNVAKILPTI